VTATLRTAQGNGLATGTKEWALPLAASSITQGSGLIRSAQLSALGTATPQPTSTPATAARTPATPTVPQPGAVATAQTLQPGAGLAIFAPSAAVTPSAQPTTATTVAAPAVLQPAGFPPPPFALLLPGSPLTATTLSSTPAISTAVDVRSTLPGVPPTVAAVPSQPAPSVDTVSTVVAAGPAAPAAHVRFGPPPPSPR
jgi:hypothetical protein